MYGYVWRLDQFTAFKTFLLCPSRNKQRMHFALKSLLQEAQNNLRIFKVRVLSIPWWLPATGSVSKYIEVSRLVCLRPALCALSLQEEEEMPLKEVGDEAGLALAGGGGCGHAGNLSRVPFAIVQVGSMWTCVREQD